MKRLILCLILSLLQANEEEYRAKIIELATPFNLSDTILAIAKVESDMGKYMINLQDPSCGLTHININTYIRRHKVPNTAFNRNKICQDLVNDVELAISNSIEELLFWKSQFCPKNMTNKCYRQMIRAYNGGWNYNSKKAKAYEIKVLKYLQKK